MLKKQTFKAVVSLILLLFIFTIFAPFAGAVVSEDNNQQNEVIVAKSGDYGSIVKEIKIALKSLGYLNYYGTPSSYYSTITKYAVKYFQRGNGLETTGVVDQTTYVLLKEKYLAKAGTPESVKPTPQPEPTLDPQPDSQPDQQPDQQPDSQPEPELQPQTQPVPEQPTPEPAPQPEVEQGRETPEQVSGLTDDEKLMLNLINQERAKAGVAPLKVDLRLVQSARVKSKDMIDNNYFSHTSSTLGSFSALIRKYAPDYSYIGENLAGNRSVQAAHTALMNSEGHRKNLLNPNFTHLGIGIVDGGPYGKMFTQHFGG